MSIVTSGLSISKEMVRPVLESVVRNSEELIRLVQPAKRAVQIGRYLYRAPFETRPSGLWRKYSADGGVMGKGSSFKTRHMTAGFIFQLLAVTLTHEEIKLTEGGRAITPALPRAIGQMAVTAMNMMNIALHGDGSGVLTDPSSGITGTNTLTFATASDVYKVRQLRRGMAVDAWDTTLATQRVPATTAPLFIETIDHQTGTVVFNQNITGLVVTDRLTFQGLATYGPAAPTTGAAAWPTAPASQTVNTGLGGDSFVHGMRYANEDDGALYYLGVLRSSEPQLKAEHIAAGGAGLTFAHGVQLRDRVRRRFNDGGKGLVWVFPDTQRQRIWEAGVAIANKFIGTENKIGELIDLGPEKFEWEDQFSFCDRPAFVSAVQPEDRIDGVRPADWERVVAEEMEPYKTPDGKQWFEGRNGDGAQISDFTTFLSTGFDFFNVMPGKGCFIDGLSVPIAL